MFHNKGGKRDHVPEDVRVSKSPVEQRPALAKSTVHLENRGDDYHLIYSDNITMSYIMQLWLILS